MLCRCGWAEREEDQTPETIFELAYLRDPKLFDRDGATRHKARADLKPEARARQENGPCRGLDVHEILEEHRGGGSVYNTCGLSNGQKIQYSEAIQVGK